MKALRYLITLAHMTLVLIPPVVADEPRPLTQGHEEWQTWQILNWRAHVDEAKPLDEQTKELVKLGLSDEDIAHYCQAETFEINRKNVRIRMPVSEKWRLVPKLLKVEGEGHDRYTLARFFLEDPQPGEQITLTGHSGKLFFPREFEFNPDTNGHYHEVDPGGFSAIDGINAQLKATAPFHFPFVKGTGRNAPGIETWGDILLRRPDPKDRASLKVSLKDSKGNPVTDWTFRYGTMTFGGDYGDIIPLDEEGQAKVSGLAPQIFQIGFSERMLAKWRSEITLEPGKSTIVTYRLSETEELSKPEVRTEPAQMPE